MNDMTAVIIPKSDQINADDLIAGPVTIKIREVQIKGGQEQPVSVFFDGSQKAFRPCKSMCRVMVAAWGADANKYVGRRLTLYRDEAVKWGGMEVGGIRISHMSDITEPLVMALTATKGSRKPFRVLPLPPEAEPPKPAAKQTPEQWAGEQIAVIQGIQDPAALSDWRAANAKKLAALKDRDAATWAKVDAAISAKMDALVPPDDPFGLPPHDPQTGEVVEAAPADPFDWVKYVELTAADIATAQTIEALNEDWTAIKERMDERNAPQDARDTLTRAYLERAKALKGGRK